MRFKIFLWMVFMFFGARAVSAASLYQLIDLGNGFSSQPFGLNSAGRTAGQHGVSNDGSPQTWTATAARTPLPLLGGVAGSARDLNDSNLIVGRTRKATPPGDNFVATAWDFSAGNWTARTLAQLESYPYSSAMSVNAAGVVVGYSHNQNSLAYYTDGYPTSPVKATKWTGVNQSVAVNLGLPGEKTSAAFDVNAAGYVVGESESAMVGSPTRAILWDTTGTPLDLGTLAGGFDSYARAINDSNVVVGKASGGPLGLRAFRWANNLMTALPTLDPAASSWANDINNSGLIVGSSNDRAVLWDGNSIVDLNTVLTGIPLVGYHVNGLNLSEAFAINDAGWIAVRGTTPEPFAAERSYLLVPVPEPSAGVLLLAGGILTALFLRRSPRLALGNSQPQRHRAFLLRRNA